MDPNVLYAAWLGAFKVSRYEELIISLGLDEDSAWTLAHMITTAFTFAVADGTADFELINEGWWAEEVVLSRFSDKALGRPYV